MLLKPYFLRLAQTDSRQSVLYRCEIRFAIGLQSLLFGDNYPVRSATTILTG
jgi:hypothetical protein